ncbi:MAG: hypothetical protein CME26_03130 [Gemmatimonadetes bacterium]|nr:hypothetical protein [Gemmatimonadota bacterium]|tara:strand:- start:18036 stop:19097 length:1062 start_codon:yes stop_codon:yes gene_type:complete
MTLSCDTPDDVGQWTETLSRFDVDVQDIYFRPEYVSLHAHTGEGRLYIYEEGGDSWIYPMLVRPIDRVGHKSIENNWFDIETPYGYGGPISTTKDPVFLEKAHDAFDTWCRDRGIVAEFLRFHPLIRNEGLANPKVERVHDRSTFSIDLAALGPDEMAFASRARNSIRRARKLGLQVVACRDEEDLERFRSLYRITMDRKDADSFYQFDDRYFCGLNDLIHRRGYLLTAQIEGTWVAAGVFLRGERILHYHLSASSREIYVPGATNLLLYEAAQLGREAGLSALHLGGGLTGRSDDSLAGFKQSMSNASHDFVFGKRVHDPDSYDVLRRIWNEQHTDLKDEAGSRVLFYRYGS